MSSGELFSPVQRAWRRSLSLTLLLIALLALLLPTPAHAQTDSGEDGRPAWPDERLLPTAHFLIHYTLSGEDAVPIVDANQDGIPDFVALVGVALEATWNTQIVEGGWDAPPPDGGLGGDDRLDVYLANILVSGIAGYVSSDGGLIRDNPNSDALERAAAYSYMVLDNDYAEVFEFEEDAPPDRDRTFAASVVAHEFHHMVQAGYDSLDVHGWLYEATSMWIERASYPDSTDALDYLPFVLQSADSCLAARSGKTGDGLRWYGDWLFLEHLSESYGPEIVRSIWEESRSLQGFEAIDAALAPYDSNLELESLRYAVRNALRDYPDGDAFPTVVLAGESGSQSFIPADGVASLGADLIAVAADSPVSFTLVYPDAALTLSAVGILPNGTADVFPASAVGYAIDPAPYDLIYLVIHNGDREVDPNACTFAAYNVIITPAEGSAFFPPPDLTVVAPHFAPLSAEAEAYELPDIARDRPFGGGLSEDGTYSDFPAGIQVPFTPVVPASGDLPAGYAFDFASVREADSYGFLEDYYVPGGDAAAVYDYVDPAGHWIGITQSVSPYFDVDAWLEDTRYNSPGEVREVKDVQVLVEDLSKNGETWISATLVVGGLFVVIDGSEGEEAVLAMVDAYIAAATGESLQATPGAFLPTPVPFPTAIPYLEFVGNNPAITRASRTNQLMAGAMCLYILLAAGGAILFSVLALKVIPKL